MRSPLLAVGLLLTGCEALTDGFYVVGVGGQGGQAAGGGSVGGGPQGPCASVAMLVDGFDDGILARPWSGRTYNGALWTEEDGLGVVRMPATMGGSYAERFSTRLHDLRNSEVRIEIVEPPSAPEAYASLLVTNGERSMGIAGPGYSTNHADKLVVLVDGAVESNLSFLPDQHRWWRIRENNGELLAETSPSGEAWDVVTRLSAFDVSFVEVSFGAFNYNMSEVAVARFDRVNGGGAFEPEWCKAATLTDDFESNEPKPEWIRRFTSDGCLLTQTEGGVVIEFDPAATVATTNGCGYSSGYAYDLRDSSFSLELAENSISTTNENEGAIFFRIVHDANNFAQFVRPAEVADATLVVDGESQLLALVPQGENWWRFRESNGSLFWETSLDGASWTTLYETAAPFPLDDVQPFFGMSNATLAGASGRVKFDNFNLP